MGGLRVPGPLDVWAGCTDGDGDGYSAMCDTVMPRVAGLKLLRRWCQQASSQGLNLLRMVCSRTDCLCGLVAFCSFKLVFCCVYVEDGDATIDECLSGDAFESVDADVLVCCFMVCVVACALRDAEVRFSHFSCVTQP